MLRRKTINTFALIALIVLALFSFYHTIPWWAFALVTLIWFLITLCGSFLIRWDYHFKSIHSNKNNIENDIAITFDDGPHPEFTPKILSLLENHNAKATFFCIGKHIEEHPALFKAIIKAGHTVGNHTYSHSKSFGFFNSQKVTQELQKTNNIVKELIGKQMRFYRPAFAVTNPSIEKAVKQLKLDTIGWSVRSLDTTPRNSSRVLKRITSKVAKGDIVLLHDTSDKTVVVLEQLLLFLKDRELRSVAVDQLLQLPAYE